MARPFTRQARSRYRSLNPNQSSGNALTSSGVRLRKADGDTMRRLFQPWQTRAFAYYDIVPEIKYAAQFYSRALSVIRLYVAEKDANGELVETQNEQAVAMLERIQDPGGGGREGLQATYGRLMFLNGECYLFASKDADSDEEQWECLSTAELRPGEGGYVRYSAPALMPETFSEPSDDDWAPIGDNDAVAYRLWRRHPKFSQLPDATMQGVLDVCEELVLLTQSVRARARSRLAGSGILLVNGKYIPLPAETEPGEDTDDDPFMKDLTDAMTSPIVDEGSASAVVPHVVRIDVDGKLDDVMKHIQIIDPMQTYPETGLRYELIKRLAIGLDMPPEILIGLADSNHWNAWQIDEQTWKGHLQPVANALVNDLTTAFFQPSLKAEGIADWAKYVITYDATAVINHPDRSKDAKELYDRRAIGKEALREANGFSEDDAPTEEERTEMIGVAVRDGSLALFGIPNVRSGGLEPIPGEIVSGQGDSGTPPAGTPTAPQEEAPNGGSPPQDPITSSAADAFVARVIGASEIAFQRSRELAGSRLRNYARRNPDAEKLIDGVYGAKVAPTLGFEGAQALKCPPARELVAGGAQLLLEILEQWGVDTPAAIPLGDRLEQHAAKTLFDARPAPLPPSYTNYVLGLANPVVKNGSHA